MSGFKRAHFQDAAVEHIVRRLTDSDGSRRMLLADEVGLGKTIVARGVIEKLAERRRKPLTVIYLCSNVDIAEQNRTKLDPKSQKPVGRVTELALARDNAEARLALFSFTPGTSLKDGTGLAWERRLLLYLLHRIWSFDVWKAKWREFFRCTAGEDRWLAETTKGALFDEYERKTSVTFQGALAKAWREASIEGRTLIPRLRDMVDEFDRDDRERRGNRNACVARLRGVMQRVALKHLEPDLVILDEVQRFRDVLEEATNAEHIASELFQRRVPVLILSATPYRALTLGHEIADGDSSHHEDFFKTLDFLFDRDKTTPQRIRQGLMRFGQQLKHPSLTQALDEGLLSCKRELERDLTKVICRTERNWYVLDHRKGVDDTSRGRSVMPALPELEEYFRLQTALKATPHRGQVTEFWKSAPSLLTFLDAKYALLRHLDAENAKVPRTLLAAADRVGDLAKRNHRISALTDITLGEAGKRPPLWAAPTYTYYRDEFYGDCRQRKVLVFSGWRFVPKAVAIISSQAAADRLGPEGDPTQPLRFSEKRSFHVFDVCFPSPALAEAGHSAYVSSAEAAREAMALVDASVAALRRKLTDAAIEVVPQGGNPAWQVVLRLERSEGRGAEIRRLLDDWERADREDVGSEMVSQHREWAIEWLSDARTSVRVSEARLRHLALVSAYSPANCVLRALQSVYGENATASALSEVATLCLGPLRRFFNRPHVQQIVRQHEFRMPWKASTTESEIGYAERVLVYAADAHLQAVLDEYTYLLRNAGQGEDVQKAIGRLDDIWTLSKGSPRTNGPKGAGANVRIEVEANVHSAHFALAFGEDVARESGPDAEDEKLRKSVVREAFNSPFWPFILATTSVGQEGLDFHLYCRDVMHWNLPSNPVDLEQREGRVNRRDCLAVRESIAKDWPIADGAIWGDADQRHRNPWPIVFDRILERDDIQKYKHGLFPHWVYECRNSGETVRIQRHVPFFASSRDAAKYERLKTGLALYRLVFGQVNQEDLLEHLQRQVLEATPEMKKTLLRRLTSYMLNLSPIGREYALRQSREEAEAVLTGGGAAVRTLVDDVKQILHANAADLSGASMDVLALIAFVEQGIVAPRVKSSEVQRAVSALCYLRNPYDRIFDLHVEGGFVDDVAVVRDTCRSLGIDVASN